MNYHDQWKALSSRIRGLMQAGQLDARYLTVRTSHTFGRSKRLREHCEGVLEALKSFRDRFQYTLPAVALTGRQTVRLALKVPTRLVCDLCVLDLMHANTVFDSAIGKLDIDPRTLCR